MSADFRREREREKYYTYPALGLALGNNTQPPGAGGPPPDEPTPHTHTRRGETDEHTDRGCVGPHTTRSAAIATAPPRRPPPGPETPPGGLPAEQAHPGAVAPGGRAGRAGGATAPRRMWLFDLCFKEEPP